jgi:hypothetical protein
MGNHGKGYRGTPPNFWDFKNPLGDFCVIKRSIDDHRWLQTEIVLPMWPDKDKLGNLPLEALQRKKEVVAFG